MNSLRCIRVVKDELKRVGLSSEDVKLGEATINGQASPEQLEALRAALQKAGLELIDNRKSRLIERIKALVIARVRSPDEPLLENFSSFLSRELHYDYNYLSGLFAASEGITLERFIIQTRIEKVKELLIYEDLTIAEIAVRMNYCSAAHLSAQFKKVTGFTASYYKTLQRLRSNDGAGSIKDPRPKTRDL